MSRGGSRWPYVAAVLLGIAWAFVAHAPASWVAGATARMSGERVLLCDARGDWHDGAARVVLSAGPQGRTWALLPGVLHWNIGLRDIWRGVLSLRLQWPGLAQGPLSWQARAGIGSWSVRQIAPASWEASLPAVLLQGLGTPWNTLAPRGLVRLRLHQADLSSAAGRLRMQGDVRIDALNMSSRLSTIAPLGSYRLGITGDGPAALVRLSTLEGPLELSGSGVFNGDRLQFSGTARAAAGQQQALATLLGLLGQPEGDHVRIAL
jgi:general secretion pathway protein N